VTHLRLSGRQGQVREVRMTLADGDTSVMRIEPCEATRRPGLDARRIPRRWRQPVPWIWLAAMALGLWLCARASYVADLSGLPALLAPRRNRGCCWSN
jgi:hypothetical protein